MNKPSLLCYYCLFVAIIPFHVTADNSVEIRPYLNLHLGRSLFTNPDAVAGARLGTPSGQPTFGATLGADIGRYWSLELAFFDYVKTDLLESSGAKAGDYSLATLLGQARFRYPVWHDWLVPYILAGGGIGLGEFSGREDFSFRGGGSDTVPLGVVGAGVEYFVADNLALGIEAKHYFLFRPSFSLEGQHPELTADSIGVTAGMRVYLDRLGRGKHAQAARQLPARDSDALRGYLALRAGKALFTNPHAASGLDIENPSGILGNATVGMSFNKYLGAELAFDYARAQLTSPALGEVSGYPIWTFTALGRLRYPVLKDRLVPYLVAGGGVGFGEGGDLDKSFKVIQFEIDQDSSIVGVIGAGVEFFVEKNVAFGIELKYTTFFDTDIEVNGQPTTLSPEFVSLTAGICIFFP
jgi:opacity protein-like surface antigen